MQTIGQGAGRRMQTVSLLSGQFIHRFKHPIGALDVVQLLSKGLHPLLVLFLGDRLPRFVKVLHVQTIVDFILKVQAVTQICTNDRKNSSNLYYLWKSVPRDQLIQPGLTVGRYLELGFGLDLRRRR